MVLNSGGYHQLKGILAICRKFLASIKISALYKQHLMGGARDVRFDAYHLLSTNIPSHSHSLYLSHYYPSLNIAETGRLISTEFFQDKFGYLI